MNKKTWLMISFVSLGVFYLNLTWKATSNFDNLITNFVYLSLIFYLLWRRSNKLIIKGDLISVIGGLFLLVLVLVKSLNLFEFESQLVAFIPFLLMTSLALIFSGIREIKQYRQELFFTWFLFFPEGLLGHLIDNLFNVTTINAKIATYFLYYLGFNVANQSNQVMLNLPNKGVFKAIVDYPCAGLPMIILMLKISLLLVCFYSLQKKYQVLIPLISVVIGFLLGVMRVSLLTLVIPNPEQFAYWHGDQGSQIFSTLAILIFSGFAYWIIEKINITKTYPLSTQLDQIATTSLLENSQQ